ncbi:MAG: tetraacyldisaccharide 4'-kinase [Panacagrimonas sp.]
MRGWLENRWYSSDPAPLALRPLSAVFGVVAANRRRRLQQQAPRLSVPVIVVGNISVGGTGKTPFVIWLVEQLRKSGWSPGVISRGYGGRAPRYPFSVGLEASSIEAGDEPLLIALRTAVPVMVDPDRVAAARALIATGGVNVLVSDDGLQHYRLARDLEICVVDGHRGLGNGALLPAGPLREPQSRLEEVPVVVVNGGGDRISHPGRVDMQLRAAQVQSLVGAKVSTLQDWRGRKVHAVAGIGNPQRFFDLLADHGIVVVPHPFADHHAYRPTDFAFGDEQPVLMTEKDAVKCRSFADLRMHHVPVNAVIDPAGEAFVQQFLSRLKRP